jgi:aspartate-semialdehyde dehydrogenase
LGAAWEDSGYPGNVVPHNSKTDETGFSAEERKLMQESKKILGQADLSIAVQCCRVPVAVGHYENVWVRLRETAGIDAVEKAMRAADGLWLEYVGDASGAGLSSLASLRHRDHALVGRLRRDPRDKEGRAFCLTIVADNLRLGAATNAVRVASRWFPSADPLLRHVQA